MPLNVTFLAFSGPKTREEKIFFNYQNLAPCIFDGLSKTLPLFEFTNLNKKKILIERNKIK